VFVRSAVTAFVALISATGLAAAAAVPSAASVPSHDKAFSFGVIGDIPYGAAEIAKFPARIQDINALTPT
jgi:hypothetical protein